MDAERYIIKSSAQKHIDAYLEYRMIVGDRDGGKLLPEEEYEKLRKEFYANRRKGPTILWSGGKKHEMLAKGTQSESSSSGTRLIAPKKSSSSTGVVKKVSKKLDISPLTLLNKKPELKSGQLSRRLIKPLKKTSHTSVNNDEEIPDSEKSEKKFKNPRSSSLQSYVQKRQQQMERARLLREQREAKKPMSVEEMLEINTRMEKLGLLKNKRR